MEQKISLPPTNTKMKRYTKNELNIALVSRAPSVPSSSEPHRIMERERVWTVFWRPSACGGYPVAQNLTRAAADETAARIESVAKNKGWVGRADVLLSE